ncbi:chemotaxis protein CheW [Tropicibacter sp. S64]|uniref:chemotaxis protein CheW n=1 Tax=Tropicibacter sp. S64 TaxID=3415122 RepID=UPI003C7E929F
MTQTLRQTSIADGELVTFELSNEVLAVPTAQLREVLEPSRITRVPGADEFVSGLLNVRGAVVPLADLRVPLRMPRDVAAEDPRILVLELPLAGQDTIVGILADSVYAVTRIELDALEDIPPVGTRWPPRFVSAVGRWGDGFVTIPDLPVIFADYLSGQHGHTETPGIAGKPTETEAKTCD